ncbi:MAG: rRNA pseudouridine synthase [Alicyclobacillus sp.]|nr:rRNA pseudouridine synthase [Alicyclobacillus sp.]
MPERLQKVLARAGIASRRKSEELIISGRVTVDHQVVQALGTTVDPSRQVIHVDGKPIAAQDVTCVLLHKPVAYVTTTHDPEGRRTVMDLVSGLDVRLYPVGRLDYDSSGLLLLTNDGALTERLLHPRYHVEKTYRVTVVGMPEASALKRLQQGIELDDGVTAPAQVVVLRHHPKESVLEVTIHEGRNRQIRRMFEAIGNPVKRLKRIRFGPLTIDRLASGHWRPLRPEEWVALYAAVDLTPPESAVRPVKLGSNQRHGTARNRRAPMERRKR